MFSKIKNLIVRHKFAAFIVIAILVGGGYLVYSKVFRAGGEVLYATSRAEKGTLIVSVTGSGNVSAVNQIDIKPKVSGDVIYVGAKSGSAMRAGDIILRLDSTDAEKAVRDAEANLESAEISLERLKQSSADILKITEDAFNNVSNAFLDFPKIINDAEIIIVGSTIVNGQSNDGYYRDFVSYQHEAEKDKVDLFITSARNDYQAARALYDEVFLLYKNTSRYAESGVVFNLLDKTTAFAKSLAQALKSEQNLLDFLTDYGSTYSKPLPSIVNGYKSTLASEISQTNNHLSNLISTQNTIKNLPLDIRAQELTVNQRKNALADAKEKLADYYIRAPWNGILSKINVKEGDSVSPQTVVATFSTRQKIAEISLNEIDVAKVKVGQKATLTFDAVPDLSITGRVGEIDAVGTISQGVVTYTVKIVFDTDDDRVKPGMSVSAAIITDSKTGVLLVPNSAIKEFNSSNYVELPDPQEIALAQGKPAGAPLKKPPVRAPVQIGASNDEFTEIVSGLKEGDLVITRVIQPTATTAQPQQTSAFRIPGIGGGGGGFRGGGLGR